MTSRRVVVCMNQLVDAGEARAIRAGDAPPPPPWDGHQLGLLRGGGVGLFLDDARPPPAVATKRRAPGTEAWGPAKLARPAAGGDSTGLLLDEIVSMPSPPLHHHHAGASGNLTWHELGITSPYPAGTVPMGVKSEAPPAAPFIPDSFLTPHASPRSSFTASPPPPPITQTHPTLLSDDLSFFEPQSAGRRQQLKVEDDLLPELDLSTLTSYFDLLESSSDSDPLPLLPQTTIGDVRNAFFASF